MNSDQQERQVHPAALAFPMMPEKELRELAEDIKTHGLLEPIGLLDGKILDGRNRLKACELAEVEPRFTEVDLHGSSLRCGRFRLRASAAHAQIKKHGACCWIARAILQHIHSGLR